MEVKPINVHKGVCLQGSDAHDHLTPLDSFN